jgi:hypothetical protein
MLKARQIIPCFFSFFFLERSQRPSAEQSAEDKKTIEGAKRKLLGVHRKYLLLLSALIVLALLCTTIVLLNLKSTKKDYKPGDGDDLRKNIPIDSTIGRLLLRQLIGYF